MPTPLLSVVMPVRDVRGNILDAAVRSILEQTEPRFEFLIVDDGSAEPTRQRLMGWQAKDKRIRVLTTSGHGVTAALNVGVSQAVADFVARMDGDDIAEPTRFAAQLAVMTGNRDLVVLGTDLVFIDPEGRPLCRRRQLVGHAEIEAAMLAGKDGVIGHPSTVFRKWALERVGGYDERFPHSQDLDIFLRLAEVGELGNLPQPLLRYRQHFSSVSFAKLKSQWNCKHRIVNAARLQRGLNPLEFPTPDRTLPATQGVFYLRWARMAWSGGYPATALRYGTAALYRCPLEWRVWSHFLRLRLASGTRR